MTHYTYVQVQTLTDALGKIASWPASGNSDPDVTADALDSIQELAARTLKALRLKVPKTLFPVADDGEGNNVYDCPHAYLSFGEGTREEPDRCVQCHSLFLRDAPYPFKAGFGSRVETVESVALLCECGPVHLSLDDPDSKCAAEEIGRFATIRDAEAYLDMSLRIDPDWLKAGHYCIAAPFGVGADSEAISAALRSGFQLSDAPDDKTAYFWKKARKPIQGPYPSLAAAAHAALASIKFES